MPVDAWRAVSGRNHDAHSKRPAPASAAPRAARQLRQGIDRIMVITKSSSLSLPANGLALPARTQHEAAPQRSAGQRGGLGVNGVAFLGGCGHVAAPANKPPRVKKKKISPRQPSFRNASASPH